MEVQYKNFLLTGEPGVGKTTIIQSVLGEISMNAGGFFTQEIKSGKTQKGFQLITLDGQQCVLATANKKSTYKIGKFGVDIKIMSDIAVPALKQALDGSSLIIIDEIGKMECFSKEFRDIVIRCLDSKIPVLGTIQNFASPFINSITNREDVVIITVTEENRAKIPNHIIEILHNFAPPKPSKKPRK